MYKILVLNPGSTSTKVAYYEDSVNVCEQNLAVDRKVISGMKNIFDQMDLRKETIQKFLDEEHIDPKELSFIVSRGGLAATSSMRRWCSTAMITTRLTPHLWGL